MIGELNLAAFDWQQFGVETGSSAILGGIVGFATKKVAKLVLVLIGLELLLLQALEIHGVIDVKWETLNRFVGGIQDTALNENPPAGLLDVLPSLSMGGGFAGGFLVGFRQA